MKAKELKEAISGICEKCYFRKGIFETRGDGIRIIIERHQQILFHIPESRRYVVIKLNNKKEFKKICKMFPEKVQKVR